MFEHTVKGMSFSDISMIMEKDKRLDCWTIAVSRHLMITIEALDELWSYAILYGNTELISVDRQNTYFHKEEAAKKALEELSSILDEASSFFTKLASHYEAERKRT